MATVHRSLWLTMKIRIQSGMRYLQIIPGSMLTAQVLKGALRSFLKSGSIDVKSETSALSATETLFKVLRNLK
jgi:hypothetical protein